MTRATTIDPGAEMGAPQAAPTRRLTGLRLAVLRTIEEEDGPIVAYGILRRLSRELGRRLSPPSVYRSLDFLVREGAATRIESLNAYLTPRSEVPVGGRAFLLCTRCGTITELIDETLSRCVTAGAGRANFTVERAAIELHGICRGCGRSDLGDRSEGAEARR